MPILLASDLQGQLVKESVKQLLIKNGCDVFDMGFVSESNISKIGEIVHNYPQWAAIVFCRNAASLSVLLNGNFTNVRSIVANTDEQDMFLARNKHKANIMCFPMNCVPNVFNLVSTFVTA
jgi:ribose 5-phosphate isomerase RpiB